MAFKRFQDFLSNLVSRQRQFFVGDEEVTINELLEKLMGTVGEVSGIVTARQLLDRYAELSDEQKLDFFQHLERSYNADENLVREAFNRYSRNPSSASLNVLSKTAEPCLLYTSDAADE